MNKETIKVLSYVRRSKHREKILLTLDNHILMPSDMSKKTNMRPTHVSRALKDLKEHNIVECLNEEETRGRLFKITDKGEEVLEEIKKIKNK